MVIGYTTGVFDLFHVGHVNILKNCKQMCDKLIVGITVDELVGYKNKKAVIPFNERCEIIRACRYVDSVVPQVNNNETGNSTYLRNRISKLRKLQFLQVMTN